jgi:hypothetical protein
MIRMAIPIAFRFDWGAHKAGLTKAWEPTPYSLPSRFHLRLMPHVRPRYDGML